jgi:hypothetical protein
MRDRLPSPRQALASAPLTRHNPDRSALCAGYYQRPLTSTSTPADLRPTLHGSPPQTTALGSHLGFLPGGEA